MVNIDKIKFVKSFGSLVENLHHHKIVEKNTLLGYPVFWQDRVLGNTQMFFGKKIKIFLDKCGAQILNNFKKRNIFMKRIFPFGDWTKKNQTLTNQIARGLITWTIWQFFNLANVI